MMEHSIVFASQISNIFTKISSFNLVLYSLHKHQIIIVNITDLSKTFKLKYRLLSLTKHDYDRYLDCYRCNRNHYRYHYLHCSIELNCLMLVIGTHQLWMKRSPSSEH